MKVKYVFFSDGNEIWESHLADPKKCNSYNSSLYLPPPSARKCPAEVWQIVSLHLRPFCLEWSIGSVISFVLAQSCRPTVISNPLWLGILGSTAPQFKIVFSNAQLRCDQWFLRICSPNNLPWVGMLDHTGTLAQGLHITKQSSGQCNGFSFSCGTIARCLPLRLKRHRENDQLPEITSNEPEVE